MAATLIDRFRDGEWFVELAPLNRGEYIPPTIASALGITLPSEGDLVKQLSDAEIEKLAAEGAGWSEDRAVEEALKV